MNTCFMWQPSLMALYIKHCFWFVSFTYLGSFGKRKLITMGIWTCISSLQTIFKIPQDKRAGRANVAVLYPGEIHCKYGEIIKKEFVYHLPYSLISKDNCTISKNLVLLSPFQPDQFSNCSVWFLGLRLIANASREKGLQRKNMLLVYSNLAQ